jgi:hypothetical protein
MSKIEDLTVLAKAYNYKWVLKSPSQKKISACLLLAEAIERGLEVTPATTGLQDNTTGASLDSLLCVMQRMTYAF